MEHHTLNLSQEEMRALGYRVIDIIIEHFETLSRKPVTRKRDRASLEARLRQPLPEHGSNPLEVLEQLERDVFRDIMHVDHPRFFAFVPSPSNFISVMADTIASGFNVFAGTWLEASGPAQIELVTIDWLRDACGLPGSAGGLFVSGGSMANMTALAVARQVKLDNQSTGAVIYCSDQTHSSIERGLRVLGFQDEQLRKIPSDGHFRLDMSALRRVVQTDRSEGRVPFCVVANAGTTNTGAIDPLPALADYCKKESLWLHVDGAYGAPAVLCERGQNLLTGLGRADSLSLDPHKWMFQPYEIGCVLVREESWLRDSFHILPEYLADIEGKRGEVNFCDRGIQLTRNFRALKLWTSLKVFGAAGFRTALERGFELAEIAEAALRGMQDWEVVTGAQMGVLTFRYAPSGTPTYELNRINRQLIEAMIGDGFAMLNSTELRGLTVLRLCTINPRTTDIDVHDTIKKLDYLAKEVVKWRF